MRLTVKVRAGFEPDGKARGVSCYSGLAAAYPETAGSRMAGLRMAGSRMAGLRMDGLRMAGLRMICSETS